ncbi:hypothetical protein [Actinomadura chokoriensis]|uniref:Uncharacterized protein n=1 Tax=Actinomadura chokoriensis TaxID=454156 RepID=A0ABV4QP12_9ACTN
MTVPLLIAVPAQAAPCKVTGGKHANCNKIIRTPGTGGGGTETGGGGGPWVPPPPEGLTPDEAPGVVAVPGAPAPAPAPPDTADLVAMAQAAAEFPTPTVHTAPADKTYVRLRTALWVDGFQDVQTEPITVGAQTIQLIAKPRSVTWNMGEKTFDCDDAGTKDGKTCNYTYLRSSASEPGGTYKITATINWDVAWTCVGADCDSEGGALPPNPVPSQATPLVVGEIQTNTGQ